MSDKTYIPVELQQTVIDRNFYNPHDVFNHQPEYYVEPETSKYKFKIHIYKWNTRSTRVTILGARFDEKQSKWVLSTYKQNSIKRQAHGEKMR